MEKGLITLTSLTICSAYCLQESETTVGYQGERAFSNIDEILAIDTANQKLHEFTTCVDGNGDLIGTQYTLSDQNGSKVELS